MIRRRAILAVLAGETISSLGSQLSALALPWFVLVTTGSATLMGIVFAVEIVPMTVLGIPSGRIIDRLGPRTTMLVSDLARAPVIALVPILHWLGLLSFPVLLILVVLYGTFSMTYFSCQRLLLPTIVGEDERLVAQGNALIEGATNITAYLGPALAGALILVLGAVNLLWLDAASFALSFLLIASLVPGRSKVAHEERSGGALAALRFIARDRLVGRAALSSVIYGFSIRVLWASFPVLAFTQFDRNPVVAGLLNAAWGAGAVGGSIGVYPLVSRIPPLRLGAFACVALALPLWLLVPEFPIVVVAVALAASAAAIPVMNAPYLTLLSTRVPARLRGSVLQSILSINTVAGPVGYAVAGPAFDWVGLHPVYLLIAGLVTAGSINFVTAVRAVEDEDRTAEAPNV